MKSSCVSAAMALPLIAVLAHPGTIAGQSAATNPTSAPGVARLTAVPFTDVRVEDAFWSPRIQSNHKIVLHDFKYCEETGRISNFLKAAGRMEGKFEGIYFNDSDVYKTIEGAAYSLAHRRDADLEKIVDEVIAKIAAAQQPDGYLYTFYTINKQLDKRWSDERKMHETYCAGHLIEAALAYYQATGKKALLDVAIKLADHIDSVFGPGRKQDVPGHEEIELALVKLYRQTGQDRYLKLAQFFVDERGHVKDHPPQGEYAQDHLPVRQQRQIVGHAVRAMYLYSAVADLAAISGDQGLLDAMDFLWHDVTDRKMFLTGGIGSSGGNEGFTVAYDLPNDSAYAETCASIGMAMWNHRLTLLHADAKYADVVERVMYNGLLAGVSLDGSKFFYVNPLASRGGHHRQPWFGTACCPTNMVRFLPTVGGYVYAHADRDIYVNHYMGGTGTAKLPGNTVALKQETNYPWEGDVKITIEPARPGAFQVNLRIPGWCQAETIKLNGQVLSQVRKSRGYAVIDREWKAGDVIELQMPMPVQRLAACFRVAADLGRIALQRGPLVYCLEAVDNSGYVRNLAIPRDAKLLAERRPDLLGGVTVIKGPALAVSSQDKPTPLYHPPTPLTTRNEEFVAVPYYAWDNRKPGAMVVWVPEEPSLAEPRPAPTIASESSATASHNPNATAALNDQVEPSSSADEGIPRFTWWDHKETSEWVRYDLEAAATVSAIEVYWFDDTGKGSCRVPASWKLLYREGDSWKPVENTSEYGDKTNAYNRVTFKPVKTAGLRIEVQLQKDSSGGILEWRVME